MTIYELLERIVNSEEYTDAEKKVAVSVLSREAVSVVAEEKEIAVAEGIIERIFLSLLGDEAPVPAPVRVSPETVQSIIDGFAAAGILVVFLPDNRNGVFYVVG